jgi:predicted hydrocarbon binding protein
MNEGFLKKLLYTGRISFEKGNFSALGHKFSFIAPEFLVFVGEEFAKACAPKKAGFGIFEAARKMSMGISGEMLRLGIPRKDIPQYMVQIFSAYGWGDANILEQDEYGMLVYYKNAPIPSMPDGNNIHRAEVCEFMRGAVTGAFEIAANTKVSCEETRCVLKGDHFCQFNCTIRPVSNSR